MSETHQIDQLFRDSLYSREVSYDPNEWLNAEKMLDEYDKKRFYRRFLKYLIALLLLVSSSVFISQNSLNFNNNNSKIIEGGLAASNQTSEDEAVSEPLHSDEKVEANQTDKLLNDYDGETNEESTLPIEVSSSDTDMDDTTLELATSKNVSVLETSDLLENEALTSESNEQIDEPLKEEDKSNLTINSNATSLGLESNVSLKANDMTDVRKEEKSNNLYSSRTNNLPASELILMNSLSIKHEFPDELTLEVKDEMPGIGKDKSKNFKTTGVKVILGGGLTNHINAESRESVNGYVGYLGIGYEKLIYHNLSLEARVLFSRRNAFDLTVESEQSLYGFGFNSAHRNTEFQYLDYLELPIMLNYFAHPLHQVGLGVQLNYALAQKYKESTYNLNSFTSIDSVSMLPITEVDVENKYGPTSIVKQFDLSLILYYHYCVTERMKLGVGLQLGMGDIVKSQYRSNVPYQNNQLRINLTYRLFD